MAFIFRVAFTAALSFVSLGSVLAQTTGTVSTTTSPIVTAPPPSSTPALGPTPIPLTDYAFTYPNLPYKVNPFPVGRGPQSGYNICNSTTEGPDSLCQTMFLNDITDFCLWGGVEPNSLIGNIEAIVVAYCTKKGRGTRLIPPGTLTAVQFIKAPGYIQVTGRLNQTGIDLDLQDAGGELDPHGADLAGNPLGGLVFSNNLPSSRNNGIIQVNNWSNFVGGQVFCFKACDPTITSPNFCQNIFDTQGCLFNMPASYKPDEFSVCLGDNQLPPGNSPVIPATSSCTTYASTDLYGALPTSTTSTSTRASNAATRTNLATSSTSSSKSGVALMSPSSAVVFGMFSSMLAAVLTGTLVVL